MVGSARVKAWTVVYDLERQRRRVLSQRDRDVPSAGGMLEGVLEGLQAGEVDRELEVLAVPRDAVGRHPRGDRRASCDCAEGLGGSPGGQRSPSAGVNHGRIPEMDAGRTVTPTTWHRSMTPASSFVRDHQPRRGGLPGFPSGSPAGSPRGRRTPRSAARPQLRWTLDVGPDTTRSHSPAQDAAACSSGPHAPTQRPSDVPGQALACAQLRAGPSVARNPVRRRAGASAGSSPAARQVGQRLRAGSVHGSNGR